MRRRRAERLLALLLVWVLLRSVHAIANRPSTPPPPPTPLRVDLATDPAERLERLPGIGPRRAAAIDALRLAGALHRLEDLQRIHGIGPRTVEALRTTREVRVFLRGVPVGSVR